MKPEKELKWLIKLYHSDACPGKFSFSFNSVPLTKRDFEKIMDVTINDKEFDRWFRQMLDEGIIVLHSKVKANNRNNVYSRAYIIDKKALFKSIEESELFEEFYNYFNRDRVI